MTHLPPTLDAALLLNSSLGEAFTAVPEMSLLFSNIQRQGVLMTPDGPCVSPLMVHSHTAEDFLAIVTLAAITGHSQDFFRWGEVDEACMAALKRCVK